ncbi:MAG TPA: SDR family NAD(P)-dependent oxidoreductase, partial [Chondromyces sp.]|nr:SDR family NAD(P)-dependent oxidoreductase [Chondromyces sp.]
MKQKTVLITGGGSGIGSRIARVLAEKGYHIVINYRTRKDQAEQLGRELSTQFGISVHTVQGDVSKLEDCMQMTSEVTQKFSGVDILIHNAGPYIHERKRLEEYTWDEWHYIINGNLNSLFYLTKLLSPHMRNNRWGRIITFGFDRVETAPGWIYRSAFASAKTGVASLTRTIAIEEAEHGITANMVCPGDIIDSWKE